MTLNIKCLKVKRSYVKSVVLVFWSTFFFFVAYTEWNEASEDESLKDGRIILNARIIEFAASAAAVILVNLMQFKNTRENLEFAELLFKVYEKTNLTYDLFEDSLGYQFTVVAIISEIGLYFAIISRLSSAKAESFLPLDMSKNIIGRSLIETFPFELATRYCVLLTFLVDFVRKLVGKLNIILSESLERIKITKDSEDCRDVIQKTDQWISMIVNIIRNYEKNFAFIILAFQCIAFISGVSQVC